MDKRSIQNIADDFLYLYWFSFTFVFEPVKIIHHHGWIKFDISDGHKSKKKCKWQQYQTRKPCRLYTTHGLIPNQFFAQDGCYNKYHVKKDRNQQRVTISTFSDDTAKRGPDKQKYNTYQRPAILLIKSQ